jgi:hypothetical protein
MNYCLRANIPNMATLQNFEAICNKFNVDKLNLKVY